MWLLALACRAPPAPPAPTPQNPTGDSTSTGSDSPAPPLVPLIGEALAARCPNPLPGEPLPGGTTLRAVTLTGPGRCNDGTAPRLYVRAATDPHHVDDWVWFFAGGTKCLGNEDCAERWCGEQYPFGQRHMSSDALPQAIGGSGITSLLLENSFAGWNQVFAAYCTSDRWLGAHADAVLTDGEIPYRIHFEGAQVAEDGIDAGSVGLVSDDGTEILPSLAQARTVLVAGTSAGCQGAASQTDAITVAAPDAEITTVLDSCFDPAAEVMDPKLAADRDASELNLWENGLDPVHRAQVEEACAADHPADPWRCVDMDILARNYLARVFVHHDQSDPVIYGDLAALGLTKEGFAWLAVDTFRLYEDAAPQISVHSNNCGWHTSVDDDGRFLHATVVDAEKGGPAYSEHDALAAAIAGARIVVVEGVPATNSVCTE